MKKTILLAFTIILHISVFSQEEKENLLFINDVPVKTSEFKRVYEKNLDAIDNEEAKSIEKNLELYINYKLKVKEAYNLKLDTLKSYKTEMETYKNQLSAPYLQDKEFINNLVDVAYFRTNNEVKVKHILIRVQPKSTPKDTVIAFNRINEIRDRIVNGEDFEKVAEEVSEDPSARDDIKNKRAGNKGNLGYFSAFQMVYPFENAAYNTKKGEVSKPFKTRFGYHILKVDDIRPSRGELEVAHILIDSRSSVGKAKIDEVYSRLQKNESFEELAKEYSRDISTKNKGGKLTKFGTGKMVKPFEDTAFSLTKANSYSKPFRTRFGWHIVKLLRKHPIKPLEEIKTELTDKVLKRGGSVLSRKNMISELKRKYTIAINKEAKKRVVKGKNPFNIPKDSLKAMLLKINDKKIDLGQFVSYLKSRRHKPVYVIFDMFLDDQILKYYKDNLVKTEPSYARTIKEFEEGLLLFELTQQKVWEKSSKDTLGLKKFFNTNIDKYGNKAFNEIKGEVINDYQTFLDQKWIAELRRKNKIKINKRELKKLIKLYKKK